MAKSLTLPCRLVDVQDKPRWREAFDGFAKAWNESWKSLQRFGCLVIPAEFRSIVMGPDVPISFCLVGEQDEGICALALIRFLAEQHNEFVQLVDVRSRLRVFVGRMMHMCCCSFSYMLDVVPLFPGELVAPRSIWTPASCARDCDLVEAYE